MKYRMDLSRTAREAAEKTGFDFDIVYNYLWKVIKTNHWSVKTIREKIQATPEKIFIDEKNLMEKMHRTGAVRCGASADYWENRILARQETEYD